MQSGQDLFAAGVNSGPRRSAIPAMAGSARVVTVAMEGSNTDVGGTLIDLITASTMYRSNTSGMRTVNQMFDTLLSLQR